MTVVDTTTASVGTRGHNQRWAATDPDTGRWWQMLYSGADARLEFWYSDDDGATWTENTAARLALTNLQSASWRIDVDGHAHLVYDISGVGISYRRMADIGTTSSWGSDNAFGGGNNVGHPDVVAHPHGTDWIAHVVYSYTISSTQQDVRYRKVTIGSGGTVTVGSETTLATTSLDDGDTDPTIDVRHNGDGRTVSGDPDLYVAYVFVGTQIKFVQGGWLFGSTWGWSGGTSTITTDGDMLSGAFDGTRFLMAYRTVVADSTVVEVAERDAADTTTTVLPALPALSDGTIRSVSVSYNADGDVHVLAVGATSQDPSLVVYDRAAGTWGSWTALATATVDDGTAGLEPGFSFSKMRGYWVDGSDVVADTVATFNVAPDAPGSLSPSGTTIDLTSTRRFTWTFSDSDAGDSQSAYDLRYRLTSSGTWTTVSGTSPNSYHDFAAGTFTAGDYEWQVRTYDAVGEVGPYTSSAFFTAASPPSVPSITDPVAGQTVGSETYTVVWSAPSQTSYQVRTVADDGLGAPDTATVYSDTGEVVSTSARSRTLTFDTNGRTEHIQVRVKSGGLWSAWASVDVDVSYTVPATPTVAVDDTTVDGAILVQASHPTPSGAEPTVTSVDVYRRVTTTGGDGIRIAAGLTPTELYTDWAPASGVDYGYRVKAHGDNGTTAWSAWSEATSEIPVYYGGGY